MLLPTLVIGLGGTGLKVATFVKKNVMEANKNQLPREMALMVLDTEKDIKYAAGGWGQERDAQHATGPVKIETGEYIAMTGNVKAIGDRIKIEQYNILANPALRRNTDYRHLNGWFQATYYLDVANIPPLVWNLDEGAGRYRQFGRLALIRNIKLVESKLKSAIQSLQRVSQNETLYVHVIGSLAGGTGASLFADVAHLVRRIAHDANYRQTPVILGHFVLSEAFRGTPQIKLNEEGVLENFNARMYAGLRELNRLQSPIVARSGGYPIVYEPGDAGLLNAKLESSPYSAVYLYDGVADRVQLNRQPIENGLAPAIADVIAAYIDEKSGGAFRSHSVNYNAFYSAYNIPTGAVTYGSVGIFTIELPIYHITEGWAHQLAKETLDTLLYPDPDTGVPSRLIDDMPGGQEVVVANEASNWLRNNTTSLVGKIAEWGRRASQTSQIKTRVESEILAMTAEGWNFELAPQDPRFAVYVAEAQAELKGNLKDKKLDNKLDNKYYIDHSNLSDGSDQEKALNMQRDVEDRLRQMVGNPVDIWRREGGSFYGALVRLGNHHVNEFENSLISTLKSTLNGSETDDAAKRKAGKLGYVLAFLSHLKADLETGYQILTSADRSSHSRRRTQYDAVNQQRNAAFAKLQKRAGFLGGNAKEYRDRSDELVQFQKADIARRVVIDLAERLYRGVNQLLDEARLWERVLASGIAENGGAYGLVMRGTKEVESDRRASSNAVRWVIADDEPGDSYISSKYATYSRDKLNEILDKVEWKVAKTDDSREMRIDFILDGGQPWSREAGRRAALPAGRRNVGRLLDLCREPFEQAWDDMSITAYLYQNYYAEGNRIRDLAQWIHRNCDYTLELDPTKAMPTMRTAFIRVYQDKLDSRGDSFLRDLQAAVDTEFQTLTRTERKEVPGEDKMEYRSATGQPSTDPYKITFMVYGDLLLPGEIKAFGDGRSAYHKFSGSGERWRELQIFPSETNALEIERTLPTLKQVRREFAPGVVTIMENMGNFQTAVRCLTFGDREFDWKTDGVTGLLLHEYTPSYEEGNVTGFSYWRLVLAPEGEIGTDGKTIFTPDGLIAQPLAYQLTQLAPNPSLLDAFIQLLGQQKDINNNTAIDWNRVDDTLMKAMAWHRNQWENPAAMGFSPLPGRTDARHQAELKDKAAHMVRLNALLVWLDKGLNQDRWAWAQGGGFVPPRVADRPELQAQIRESVDMLTAIRGAAEQEIANLNRRLNQISIRIGPLPQERLRIRSPFDPEPDNEPEELLSQSLDGWMCSNGHWNSTEKKFCTGCGEMKPEAAELPETRDSANEAVTDIGSIPQPPAITRIECLNGHEMQQNWVLCPFCGAAPKEWVSGPVRFEEVGISEALKITWRPKRPPLRTQFKLNCTVDAGWLLERGINGELTLIIEAEGMRFEAAANSASFLIAPGAPGSYQWSLTMRPVMTGEQDVVVRPFLDDTPGPERIIKIQVRSSPVTRKAVPELDAPIAQTGWQPDVILRVYSTPFPQGDGFNLSYVAYSENARLNLLGQHIGEVDVRVADLQRIQARLSKALELETSLQDGAVIEEISAIGFGMYELVVPSEVKLLFEEIKKKINSLLILCDLEPRIPWELLKSGKGEAFFAQAYSIGRWIEGLGVARRSEFPLGLVATSIAKDTEGLISHDEIIDLFEPGDIPGVDDSPFIKSNEFALSILDYASYVWGMHLEKAADPETDQQQTAIVITGKDSMTSAPIRQKTLDLRRKHPLITMGSIRKETSAASLTEIESIWMESFIKNGVTAFVGPRWGVSQETSRLFFRKLYQHLWRRSSLGQAVRDARRSVREAFPGSADWLSFFLVGDPMARGYLPEPSQGYVTVECPGHDLSKPLELEKSYSLLATLRLTPPEWDANRRKQVVLDSWVSPRVQIMGSGFTIKPESEIKLTGSNPDIRIAHFEIIPNKLGAKNLFISFLSEETEPRHSISLTLEVVG